MKSSSRLPGIAVVLLALVSSVSAQGSASSFERPGDGQRERIDLRGTGGGIASPFDGDYSFVELGAVPNVPASYAGIAFAPGDPDTLWLGGNAGSANGAVYAVGVVRGTGGHITGFAASSVRVLETPSIDGGLTVGPSDVTFYSRVSNEVGQARRGSSTTDKVVDLGPLGVAPSPGGLNFVPAGFNGAGTLKSLSWSGGEWNTLALAGDASGTFDITFAMQVTALPGGPEGFAYVPAGSPQLFDFSHVAVAEFTDASIVLYDLDAMGDPLPATRRLLATGFAGAPEGLTFDPVTGDLLFSVFSLANPSVFAVRGFASEGGGAEDEICDGMDNNDNGEIDEGFDLGAPCSDGVGACEVEGETVCSEDGLSTVCDAMAGSGAELDFTCDGIDDDCDGETDEDFQGRMVTCGQGACMADGMSVCEEGRLTLDCEPGEPADSETCGNGIDDDCDGATDLEDAECVEGECMDGDGDGYGAFGDATCPAGDLVDCDDSNAAINPAAIEIPGNELDENCDGQAACDACRPWKNHGQYVSCVARAVNRLVAAGLIDRQTGSGLVRDAARSDIGKRGYRPEVCAGSGPAMEPRRGTRSLSMGR